MRLIDGPAAGLSWLGRQGTRAVAALVVAGIALPAIGALLKPYVTAAVFLVFFAILLLTSLLFLSAGRGRALALGLIAAQRNMGLMLAVSGAALPDLAWLYFALSQFPIYLSPQILLPLARRAMDPPASPTGPRARTPVE